MNYTLHTAVRTTSAVILCKTSDCFIGRSDLEWKKKRREKEIHGNVDCGFSRYQLFSVCKFCVCVG